MVRWTSSPLLSGHVIWVKHFRGAQALTYDEPAISADHGHRVVNSFWGEDSSRLKIRECMRVEVGNSSLYIYNHQLHTR